MLSPGGKKFTSPAIGNYTKTEFHHRQRFIVQYHFPICGNLDLHKYHVGNISGTSSRKTEKSSKWKTLLVSQFRRLKFPGGVGFTISRI